MAFISEIPECLRLWEEDDDRHLLRLLADMSQCVPLKRTIVATGAIAVLHCRFREESGRLFSVTEIIRRINYLMHKYHDFEFFKSLPGVFYDDDANTVKCGHQYLLDVDFAKVR